MKSKKTQKTYAPSIMLASICGAILLGEVAFFVFLYVPVYQVTFFALGLMFLAILLDDAYSSK